MQFRPVTSERWDDFETLFGECGAYGGCWCMWWRTTRREFSRQQGEGNKRAMKQIVDSGKVPGLLAYEGETPIGWVSVAPREDYPSLNRSPNFKRVDDKPVWSIVCFYVDPAHRGKGVLTGLVAAAREYALSRGARIVEAYPREPGRRISSELAYMGLAPVFEEAGFVEVLRRAAGPPHSPLPGLISHRRPLRSPPQTISSGPPRLRSEWRG